MYVFQEFNRHNLKLGAIESSINHWLFRLFKFYIAVIDFESNGGDADDELQMLENILGNKRTATTNAFIGCGTSDRVKSVGASGKRIYSDVGKEAITKKVQGNIFEVWNHYEKIGLVDGAEKCKCKGCGRLYTCNPDNGTTYLRRQVQKCHLIPKYNDVGAILISTLVLLINAPTLLISTSVLLISAPALLISTSVLLISALALLISTLVLLISAPALLISTSVLLLVLRHFCPD